MIDRVIEAMAALKTELSYHDDVIHPEVKELIDDLMNKVKDKFCNQVVSSWDGTMSYQLVMDMLRQGKRVGVKNLCYSDRAVPTIKIKDNNGDCDVFDLDCLATNGFDTYIVEKPLDCPDEVSIISYNASHTTEIEYLYANPQMNRLTAHLIDGREVEYSLNILDIHHVTGEYLPEPTQTVKLTFFKRYENDDRREFYAEEEAVFPQRLLAFEVEEKLIKTEKRCPNMDILVTFPDSDSGYPCYITAEQRKVSGK